MPDIHNPTISIIMPVFNQEEGYLGQAIESLLVQTFPDFELLIIDDGSSDPHCRNTLAEYAKADDRVRIVRNEKNIGLTPSLNRGLALARGNYIARLDSDDLARPDRLQKQLTFLKSRPRVELCGSWVTLIDRSGKPLAKLRPPTEHSEIARRIIEGNMFNHSSWFFRKSLLEMVGSYSEAAIKTEDYDFLLRVIPRAEVAILPEFLCDYRINMQGISFANNKIQEWHALKARWRALRSRDFAQWRYIETLRPLLIYLLVPFFIKKHLYKYLVWKN